MLVQIHQHLAAWASGFLAFMGLRYLVEREAAVDAVPQCTGRQAFLRFPFVSPDGKYFFYVETIGPQFPTEETKYYWVDAGVLPPRKG